MTPTTSTSLLRELHEREEGLYSLVNLLALILCTLLFVMLFNSAHVVHRKVQLQNTADAVAYSAAATQARAMNAITATNHVIGEMMSLAILHEAVGGEALDHDWSMEDETKEEDRELDEVYEVLVAAYRASAEQPRAPAYETVRQKGGVHAQRTLLDCKKVLKMWLAWCYWNKAAAKAMQRSGVSAAVAAGKALESVMDAFEEEVFSEYKILNAWHEAARGLIPLKEVVRDELLPNAKRYTESVVESAPRMAQAAAERVAALNGCEGALFPIEPELPVAIDPLAKAQTLDRVEQDRVKPDEGCGGCPCSRSPITRDQIVKVTQLARASFPWVNYHRQLILDVLKERLPLCRAEESYFDHSNGASKQVCDALQMSPRHNLGLYVMKADPAPDKGYARWTEDPALADELFCTIGLAHRPPPLTIARAWGFRQVHGDGMLAYSQAMLYNANEQERPRHRIDLTCKRIVPIRQANVGYDTLNWLEGSKQEDPRWDVAENPPNADENEEENRPFELVGIRLPAEFPQVCVNWQVKLVPASGSRWRDMRGAATGERLQWGGLPEPHRSVVARLPDTVPPSLRTH